MKKNIVILTGAGMSAESGISTFRDSDGLWEKYRVEDVCTPEAWSRNPQLVLDFYNQRRKDMYKAVPNEGHKLVAALEDKYEVTVITQNVDNLHERGGSAKVLHLHGELSKVRSSKDDMLVYDVNPVSPDTKMGDKCEKGSQLRPHIVWFGEAVPMIEVAADICAKADVFVIIGTSLNVYPAAGLLGYVPRNVPVYLIDPKPVMSAYRKDIHYIEKGASEGMRELMMILDKE